MVCPGTGITIRLQFYPHLQCIGSFSVIPLLFGMLRLGKCTLKVLDVMAYLMGKYIGLCKVTGCIMCLRKLSKKLRSR